MLREYCPSSRVRCVASDKEGEVRRKDVPKGNENFAGAEKTGCSKQLLKRSARQKEAKRRGKKGKIRTVMLKHTQGRGCILIPLFLPKFQLICIVKSSYFSTHISLYLCTYIFHCYPSLHYFLGTLLESSLRGCGRMQLPEPCDGSHCEQSVLGSD